MWKLQQSGVGQNVRGAMRGVGQAFEFAVRDNFLQNELVQGLFSPCVFRHGTRMPLYFVHGYDHMGIGTKSSVDWYLQRVRQRFIIIKVRVCWDHALCNVLLLRE